MSLQRMFSWPHSRNPGETFDGWATESRQLSASLRQTLAHRISANGGGSLLPLMATPTATANQLSPSMMKHPGCRAMLPTPTANAGTGAGHQGRQGGLNLQTAVHRLPTLTADDTGHRKGKYAQGGTALSCQAGGKLNPQWVEWLMGYPLGHTALED